MNTSERLNEYYNFNPATVESVTEIADSQMDNRDYKSFLATHVLGDRDEADVRKDEFLEILPKDCENPASALVVHLAMGQPLDPNNLYQVGAIAAANPTKRFIVAPNPSFPGYFAQKFNHAQRRNIDEGDLGPVNDNLLRHLEQNDVEVVDHYGYSYGADKAMDAAGDKRFAVGNVIAIEPTAVLPRGLTRLGLNFMKSSAALNGYVKQSGEGLKAARKESLGILTFNVGLLRLSNLAIAKCLAQEGFETRARKALYGQPEMDATIAWGAASELADDDALVAITDRLSRDYGHQVSTIRMDGQKHALANDVWLQSAIVSEGLSR